MGDEVVALSRLSNLETTMIVRLKVGSISRMSSNHKEEHHSTLLCWRKSKILWGGAAKDFTIDFISSGVFSGSPFLACGEKLGLLFVEEHVFSYERSTLRTNPGVSMMLRLGQWAYSTLMTIGFLETAAWIFLKCASVRDFIISAIADAETIGLPYSSESSSFNWTKN